MEKKQSIFNNLVVSKDSNAIMNHTNENMFNFANKDLNESFKNRLERCAYIIVLFSLFILLSILLLTLGFSSFLPPEDIDLFEKCLFFAHSLIFTTISEFISNVVGFNQTGDPLVFLKAFFFALLFEIVVFLIIIPFSLFCLKIRLFTLIKRSGILHINPKIFVFLILCLVISFNAGTQQTKAVFADKYALSKNNPLEDAVAKMALEELLTGFTPDGKGGLEYHEDAFTNTLNLLEILHETDKLSLLNHSVNTGLKAWVDEKRDPIIDYTGEDMEPIFEDSFVEREINGTLVTVNEPIQVTSPKEENILVKNWWGGIRRSLDAARILKLVDGLTNETLDDIKGQIKVNFGGGDPIWSIKHSDFGSIYEAFVTAYEYELFDMFEEYSLPKFDTNAVEAIKTFDIESFYLAEWGEELSQSKTNFTFHSGYEANYSYSSGEEALTVQLPTLNDWFNVESNQPVPYQTVEIEWIAAEVPNEESIEQAFEKGLAEEVYINVSTDDDPAVLEYLNNNYNLEEIEELTTEDNTVYRYFEWNYDVLWYEMAVRITNANTGGVVKETRMNPTEGALLIELDLTKDNNIQIEVEVRQALHELEYEWDNEQYTIPLEGWKNESEIQFSINNVFFNLDTLNNNLTSKETEVIIVESKDINGTVHVVEESIDYYNSWKTTPETVMVVELENEELHMFKYKDPFPTYTQAFEITVKGRPVIYGLAEKRESEGELFVDLEHDYVEEGGELFSWNNANSKSLEEQREVGKYSFGTLGTTTGFTFQEKIGSYNVLIYPTENNHTNNVVNDNQTEILPVTIRNQKIIHNTNPIDEYVRYFPLLNQSETEFEVGVNATEIESTWASVTKTSALLSRISEVPLTDVLNIFNLIDTLYSYQNTSSLAFKDKLSSTEEVWSILDQMGYFYTLVSDRELSTVYTLLMERYYLEEVSSYTSEVDGKTHYIINKAGFVDNIGTGTWDVQGTLAGVKILKKIRAREELQKAGRGVGAGITIVNNDNLDPMLKGAITGVSNPLNLEPCDLPNHGLMWKVFVADQDMNADYYSLAYKASYKLQQELDTKYDLTYEEVYKLPRIALSKKSVLIPQEEMFWRENIDVKSTDFPINSTMMITIGLVLVGAFVSTEAGGTKRDRLWGLLVAIIVMIQSYAVASVGAAGYVETIENQLAAISKITTALEDKLYELSDNMKSSGYEAKFVRPMLGINSFGSLITPFSTIRVEAESVEDQSVEAGYLNYLSEFYRQKVTDDKIQYSKEGITTRLSKPLTKPMDYETYVQYEYQAISNQEVQRVVIEQYGISQEVLEQVKEGKITSALKFVGSTGLNYVWDQINIKGAVEGYLGSWKSLGTRTDYGGTGREITASMQANQFKKAQKIAGDVSNIESNVELLKILKAETLDVQKRIDSGDFGTIRAVADMEGFNVFGVTMKMPPELLSVLNKSLTTVDGGLRLHLIQAKPDAIKKIATDLNLVPEKLTHKTLNKIMKAQGYDETMYVISCKRNLKTGKLLKGPDNFNGVLVVALLTSKSATEIAADLGKRGGLFGLVGNDKLLRDALATKIFEANSFEFQVGDSSLYRYLQDTNNEVGILVISTDSGGEVKFIKDPVAGAAQDLIGLSEMGSPPGVRGFQNVFSEAIFSEQNRMASLNRLYMIADTNPDFDYNFKFARRAGIGRGRTIFHPTTSGTRASMAVLDRWRPVNGLISTSDGNPLRNNLKQMQDLADTLTTAAEIVKQWDGSRAGGPTEAMRDAAAGRIHDTIAKDYDDLLVLMGRSDQKDPRLGIHLGSAVGKKSKTKYGLRASDVKVNRDMLVELSRIATDRLRSANPDATMYMKIERIHELIIKAKATGNHENTESVIISLIMDMNTKVIRDQNPVEIEALGKIIHDSRIGPVVGKTKKSLFQIMTDDGFISINVDTLESGYFFRYMYGVTETLYGTDVARETFSSMAEQRTNVIGRDSSQNTKLHLFNVFNSYKTIYGLGSAPEGLDLAFVKRTVRNGLIQQNEWDMCVMERKRGDLREGQDLSGAKRGNIGIEVQITLRSMIGLVINKPSNSWGTQLKEVGSGGSYVKENDLFREVQYLINSETGPRVNLRRGIICDTTGRKTGIVIDFNNPEFTSRLASSILNAIEQTLTKTKSWKRESSTFKPVDDVLKTYENIFGETGKNFSEPLTSALFGSSNEFLSKFFGDFYNDNFASLKSKYTSKGRFILTEVFWINLAKQLTDNCLVRMSPAEPSLITNFVMNGIPEEYLSLNEKVDAMTSAYYQTNGKYEEPSLVGEGYVQGEIADSSVTLLKTPDVTTDEITLDWGENIGELNTLLDRDNPADYMIVGGTEQSWDNTNKKLSWDGSLDGLPGQTVIGVEKEDKIVAPTTGLLGLLGATIPLDIYPTVSWNWKNKVLNMVPDATQFENIRGSDNGWNQGEVVFTVKNSEGKVRTIGVMTTTDPPNNRASSDWNAEPDVKLYVDPITWVDYKGYVDTDGEVKMNKKWESPYVQEQINLYDIARDAFIGQGYSIEGLQLVEMSLGNNIINLPGMSQEAHETYFGEFNFVPLEGDNNYNYWQTAVKAFYKEYTESDDEISLADEENYALYADQLAIGTIDGATDMYGENNAQEWFVTAQKQDIYDEFAEFIGHGIVLIKDSNGEYIGVFHSSYTFPENDETLNAPKWTRVPSDESIPTYVYYDGNKINGWDQELWHFVAMTLVQLLIQQGHEAILANAEELFDVMTNPDVRAIVIILGAIPSNLWGYVSPETGGNAEGQSAKNTLAVGMVEDNSVIELFMERGGTMISAGPYGGLRGVCYIDENGDPQIDDYRDGSTFPLVGDNGTVTITADPAQVLLDTSSYTSMFSSTVRWMDENTTPDITDYYSSGINTNGWSSADQRKILQTYAVADTDYKDIALQVNDDANEYGYGIYVNYHTTDDNTDDGAINWNNGQGFIDDLVTIITGMSQTQMDGFIPTNNWTPSTSGQSNTVYAFEDFESSHTVIGNYGEAGTVNVGDNAIDVNFVNTYTNPVVVAVPMIGDTENRSGTVDSQHHIITDVQTTHFTIVQRESGTGDSIVDTSPINFLVLEEGTYSIGDLDVEVGTQSVNGSYETVNLTTSFSSNPVILAATQTDNNNAKVRTRVQNITTTSFDVQVEDGDTSTPSLTYDETVGYVAIEQGVDSEFLIESNYTPDAVTDNFSTYSYTNSYISPPIVIAHLDKEDGGNPSLQVVRDITTTNFETAVEETCGLDGSHTSEVVGWVSIPVKWNNLEYSKLNGETVGKFQGTSNKVFTSSGIFSDLTGINVSEYPVLGTNIYIPEEWTGVYTELHEHNDSYFSGTLDTSTTDRIEGSTATQFEYSLPTTQTPVQHESAKTGVNIDITDETVWTFEVKPELYDSDDLNTIEDFDTGSELVTRPDVWRIILKITVGTGLTKYLHYYYSFKTTQMYNYQEMTNVPTDYTQYYNGSSWERMCNYSDGNSNDVSRFVEIPMVEGEWNRFTQDILADFNNLFVTDETKIRVDDITIKYTANTYTNSNKKNKFYLDDCIFVKPDSDEYWLEQDYTDGINIYRVYSGISSDGKLTIGSVDREDSEWWYSDFGTTGYDYGIVNVESSGSNATFAAEGTEPGRWVGITSDGVGSVSLIASKLGSSINSLYYHGKPTIYRYDNNEDVYIDNVALYGTNDIMTL
ncbi:MAG: hypothetical protein ACXADY_10020, partial [Candidatus Hodarchaeales archaeon]